MRRNHAALLCAAFLAACNPQPSHSSPTASPQRAAAATTPPGVPALNITGKGTARQPVRIYYTKNNRTQYQLQALSSYANAGAQQPARATFDRATLHFFGKDGSTMTASAPRTVVDERADTVTLAGGVHATTGTGSILDCDTLVYDRSTEMLHGSGNVRVSDTRGMHATANTIDSDVSLTHTRMQ